MPFLTAIQQISVKTIGVINSQPWSVKVLAFALAAFAPLKDYVHFLVFLLVIDAITSIYYQYKQKRLESDKGRIYILFHTIESSKLRRTIEKMVAYVLALIVFFLFDKIVLQICPLEGNPLSYLSLTNIAVIMICGVEVFSIAENLSRITDNPIFRVITRMFRNKVKKSL